MTSKNTQKISGEELEELLNKGKYNSVSSVKESTQSTSHVEKPEGRNQSDFLDAGKNLATLKPLREVQIESILRSHRSCWKLGNLIGEGGFSTVYILKENEGEKKEYALKLIDPFMAYKNQYRGNHSSMKLSELENDKHFQFICTHIDTEFAINTLISKKEMQNCVPFYPEYSFIDDSIRRHVAFIVLELMDGSLQSRMTVLPDSTEDWRIAYDMLVDILADLQFLSQHNAETNIFVRDLKPANILYKIEKGRIHYYISDFGMGSIGEYSTRTQFSSPGYTAPEAYKDIRSDLFSLARAAFYICNGFDLGKSEHADSSEYQIDQTRERQYWDNTPEQFKAILQKATDPDPNKRWKSASEMLKAIHACSFDKTHIFVEPVKANLNLQLERKYQKEIAELQKRIEELEDEKTFDSTNGQILALSRQITIKDEEINKLNRNLKDVREKLQQLQSLSNYEGYGNNQLIEETERLQNELKETKSENGRLSVKADQLDKIRPAMQKLQEEFSLLQTKDEALQEQYAKSGRHNKHLVMALSIMCIICACFAVAIMSQAKKYNNYIQEKTELQNEIMGLNNEKRALKTELDKTETEKQELADRVEEEMNNSATLSAKLDESEKKNQELTAAIEKAEKGQSFPYGYMEAVPLAQAEEGDMVIFGHYEQDNNPSNGKEPIECIVLDKHNNELLLVTRYVLDCAQFKADSRDVAWDNCDLRKRLNEEFYNEAYNDDEKKMIIQSELFAEKNPRYQGVNPGEVTKDNIFLLSIREANEYFESEAARRCIATQFAIANGVWPYKGTNTCFWWLRSPGIDNSHISNVDGGGAVNLSGTYADWGNIVGVRPAFRITLD